MFAKGMEGDPFNYHEITRRCASRLLKDCAEDLKRVMCVPAGQLQKRARDTTRRFYEAISRRILADRTHDFTRRLSDPRFGIGGGRYSGGGDSLDLHAVILAAPT